VRFPPGGDENRAPDACCLPRTAKRVQGLETVSAYITPFSAVVPNDMRRNIRYDSWGK